MKIRWCWRCQMDIPMLEAEEWELVLEARRKGMTLIYAERDRRGLSDFEPLALGDMEEEFRAFLEMYRLLTGFGETNPNAVWHHIADLYGPDCPSCGKPLRTPIARYCAACGFGMEDFNAPDTKPLVERKPELF